MIETQLNYTPQDIEIRDLKLQVACWEQTIDDIKAEIYEELNNDEGASYGLGLALGIIDKHTKGDTK